MKITPIAENIPCDEVKSNGYDTKYKFKEAGYEVDSVMKLTRVAQNITSDEIKSNGYDTTNEKLKERLY